MCQVEIGPDRQTLLQRGVYGAHIVDKIIPSQCSCIELSNTTRSSLVESGLFITQAGPTYR